MSLRPAAMADPIVIPRGLPRPPHRLSRLAGLCLVAAIGAASCVPLTATRAPVVATVMLAALPAEALPAAPEAPAPPPSLLPPGEAEAANAAIPLAGLPNPAADAFFLRLKSAGDRSRALGCMTAAVYYEAASESDDGQRAVAQVVLNRVAHPAWPNSVCGVVFQGYERSTGCQFSFTCDGALLRRPSVAGWAHARVVAATALAGRVHAGVGLSTHYHTHAVFPSWAPKLNKTAVIGAHIFYRLTGGWSAPATFRNAHAGAEPGLAAAAQARSIAVASAPPLVATPAAMPLLPFAAAAPLPAPTLQDIRERVPGLAAAPTARREPIRPEDTRHVADLPESGVREEWKASGQLRPEYAAK